MRVSDAYIQKGDYLKISNIQIGYTFPKNVLKPVKMENARVFASVDNVCTISSYNKFGDPEVGDSSKCIRDLTEDVIRSRCRLLSV